MNKGFRVLNRDGEEVTAREAADILMKHRPIYYGELLWFDSNEEGELCLWWSPYKNRNEYLPLPSDFTVEWL